MPFWRRHLRSSRTGGSSLKSSSKSQKPNGQPPNTLPEKHQATEPGLSPRLEWIKNRFSNTSDVIYRKFALNSGEECVLIYIRGMINQEAAQNFIIRSLHRESEDLKKDDIYQILFEDKSLHVSTSKIVNDLNEGIQAVLDAGALLLIDGDPRMVTFSISSYPTRSIDEAPNESVIRGPREAFIEDLEINLTMLRRRLKSTDFKTEAIIIGKNTKTDVIITYMEGICKPELIKEMKRRLSYLEIDSALGSAYIEEAIEDNPYSPFPQIQYSERPDVVSAALLEGRLAVLVDGTPMMIIVPVTLPMLLQSAEDYFQRFVAATWIRWIRYLFLFISLLLPSLYIAVSTFHPEMIPKQLLLTLAASRAIVPFPAFLEAFMMEVAFEALREASVRIPKSIGQAVSIIGALIIGTAAVEAGIVSAAMVIIVSLTGIASFIIPHFDLGLSFRLLRFPIMLLATMFGLYGIACGLILIYIHMINLKSFGVPYLSPIAPYSGSDMKDTIVRAPWWTMRKRPDRTTNNSNDTRQKSNSRGWVREKDGKS